MSVCLIDVPFAMGDDRHAAAPGGRRLIEGGGRDAFARRGVPCRAARLARPVPFADTASASLAVGREVAAAVTAAVAAGELPVVIAGSCDAAAGVLAGLDGDRCGVVWIDAHADFNTPDSTVSGFFPGMALALVTGHCYAACTCTSTSTRSTPRSLRASSTSPCRTGSRAPSSTGCSTRWPAVSGCARWR